MFYTKEILTKQGQFAEIWLAAHWTKKLTKQKVFQMDIKKSVENIIHLPVPLALRLSGPLLLGIIRVYAKKVQYLASDCSEALVKIKLAFRPGEPQIDLRPEANIAPYSSITLHLPGEEEYELEIPLQQELPIPEINEHDLLNLNKASKKLITLDVQQVEHGGEEWNETGEFDDPLLAPAEGEEGEEIPITIGMGIRPPESPGPVIQPEIEDTTRRVSGVEISKSPVGPTGLALSPISPHPGEEIQVIPPSTPPPEERSSSEMSEVEIVARPPKRKLGVVVDKSLMVSSEAFKAQLNDTSNLLREFVPAPPTKKAMLRRERLNLGAEQALYRPIFEGMNPELSQFYQSLRKREQREEERDRLERERRKEEEERRREEEQVGVIEPTSPVGIIEPSSPVPSYVEPPRSPSPPPAIPPESVLPQPSRHKDVKFRQILQNSFKTTSQIVFQEYVSHQPKSVVVGSFLSILASAAQSFIKVTQAEPYADIVITPTEKLLSERFTRGEEVPAV